MGISLIIAGTVFLLNPNINIVDFLPDIIGYFLIYKGLFRLSDIDNRMYIAREKAKWLILVSAAKLGFIFLLPSSTDSDVLLFTFCFAVVETILCVPLFSDFFKGTNYLCSRYDNEETLTKESETKFFVILFVILKNVLVIVPELFSLNSITYGYEFTHDYYSRITNIEFMRKISIAGAFIIILVLGVVTGIKFISYLNSMKRNSDFIGKLTLFYTENILSDTALWAKRNQNTALLLTGTGFLFFNILYLDTVPVIPSFVGYILFIVGGIYFSRLGVPSFGIFCMSILGIGTDMLYTFFRLYNSNYGAFSGFYLDFYKNPVTLPLDLAGAVLFTVTSFLVFNAVNTATSDNINQKKFPLLTFRILMPFAALGTTALDMLPSLSDFTGIERVLPDYYALGSFLIPLCVIIITVTCATSIFAQRVNS
ncbi:MAG: hypothetical protein IJO74_04380 [Clostridia bacterium]|nr:hypothetical protein [Clostridia bacterium]